MTTESLAKNNIVSTIELELNKYSNTDDAVVLSRYFKTGIGQYGEGDKFVGIKMDSIRVVAKSYYKNISIDGLKRLIDSPIHEYRMTALIICTLKYQKTTDPKARKNLYEFYVWALDRGLVNNWDLVDVTCPQITGHYLINQPRDILYAWACSNNLWKKRTAMISTLTFIKLRQYDDTLKIARILMNDKHDLIHKAVGWMLREVGKRIDQKILVEFLDNNAPIMPRTMLRYSIEHLSSTERKHYLSIKR